MGNQFKKDQGYKEGFGEGDVLPPPVPQSSNKGLKVTLFLGVTFGLLAASSLYCFKKAGNNICLTFSNVFLILSLFFLSSYYVMKN